MCDAGWVPGKTDAKALWGLLTGSWLNLLLIVVPIGWIVHFCHLNSVLVFILVRAEFLIACSWLTLAYKCHMSCPVPLLMGYVCLLVLRFLYSAHVDVWPVTSICSSHILEANWLLFVWYSMLSLFGLCSAR